MGTVGDVPGTGANRGKKTAGTADSDINNGDVLKAVLSGAPPAHAQSFTLNQNGTFTITVIDNNYYELLFVHLIITTR